MLEKMDRSRRLTRTDYRKLLETAREGVLVLNIKSGVIEEISHSMLEMLGRTGRK